jgi:DNA recombination protein RmuC
VVVVAPLAALAGALIAWVLASAHHRAAASATLAREQARGEQWQRLADERQQETLRLQDRLVELEKATIQADTRLEESRRSVAEQRALLELAREQLHGAFADVSAKALKESKDDFLQLAEQKIGSQQTTMAALVTSMLEQLQRYDTQVRDLESRREQAYGGLARHLDRLTASTDELEREARNLVSALRSSSQVRGRWGEVALHRVVELAGMVEHCDYVEQLHVEGEGGRLRPDMIVRLPNGRQVIVDAKVPLAAYLDALDATSEAERDSAMARHAQQVRQHMNALAAKAYWDEFATAAEFVVMFIPGESFVAAAAHADATLIEDGMAKRVVVATPTTLIALLRAMHYGWRQEQLAKNAEKIRDLGNVLYERLRKFLEHVERVGGALGRAVGAYNEAVGSLEARVLPPARDFRKLGAAGGDELATLARIDQQPRELSAPELPKQLDVSGGAA